MADRKDSVALRSGNIIRIRDRRAQRSGRGRCRFISYALLQPQQGPRCRWQKRRRKARAAA